MHVSSTLALVHCGSRGRAARTSMKTVAAITADAHLLVEEDTTLLRRPGATARPKATQVYKANMASTSMIARDSGKLETF